MCLKKIIDLKEFEKYWFNTEETKALYLVVSEKGLRKHHLTKKGLYSLNEYKMLKTKRRPFCPYFVFKQDFSWTQT